MTHPNSLDLEAFALGDAVPGIAEHVDRCPACTRFVGRVRAVQQSLSLQNAWNAVQRARSRAARRMFLTAMAAAIPLAAGVILFVRSPPQTQEQGVRFKGSTQLAVIRERGGEQERFTSHVRVRAGDRLRLEVALDRDQTVLGALVGDDGSYLELMPAARRGAGMHLSDLAARVDAKSLNATAVIGPEEAVVRARNVQRFDDLATLRIEWEAPP